MSINVKAKDALTFCVKTVRKQVGAAEKASARNNCRVFWVSGWCGQAVQARQRNEDTLTRLRQLPMTALRLTLAARKMALSDGGLPGLRPALITDGSS